MPLFSAPSAMELEIERITSETNTSEDWSLILDLCDQVSTQPNAAKDCFKILVKRLNHQNPHVLLHTLTLLDACVNNCGKRFHLEVCSREFENEVKRLLTKAPHVKVGERLLQLIKKWAEMKEFKDDPQLNLLPTLYRQLKKEGYNFTSSGSSNSSSKRSSQKLPTDPNVVTSNQEEEDIAKAIEESLRVAGAGASEPKSSSHYNNSKSLTSSVYPSFESELTNGTNGRHPESSGKDSYQVRALYDFEAAEDNELTFKTGEVIVVTDDSDTNWWKGSNHRGEGLFPANFVTTDLSEPVEQPKAGKTVQFNEEVRVKLLEKEPEVVVSVDPEKIDKLISLLHEADPTGEKPDSDELLSLEEQVALMAPLIDDELQKVDRTIATLNSVNAQLVEAMNLYHTLMKESMQFPEAAGNSMMPGPMYQFAPELHQRMQHPPQGYGVGMMGMPPVTSNMPVYQSPQHMQITPQQQMYHQMMQQQQQQHQQPQSHLPPAYTPSPQTPATIPSNQSQQQPGNNASPMHHPHMPQQHQQQPPPEYMYQQQQQQQPPPQPAVSSYPGSYQQPQ